MTEAEKLISWIEGYLDASKNSLTSNQVREIRKKMIEYHKKSQFNLRSPISTGVQLNLDSQPINEDYIKAVEKCKSATTMEELE